MKKIVLGSLIVGLSITMLNAYKINHSTWTGSNNSIKRYSITCNNGNSVAVEYRTDRSYKPYMSSKYNTFNSLSEAARDSCGE